MRRAALGNLHHQLDFPPPPKIKPNGNYKRFPTYRMPTISLRLPPPARGGGYADLSHAVMTAV